MYQYDEIARLEPQNITLLYQALEKRIDDYIEESISHYKKKTLYPYFSQNILYQLRIQQMKNLRNCIELHEQGLEHFIDTNDEHSSDAMNKCASDYVSVYNELLRMQRNLQKLNSHKSAKQRETGRLADCVYDLLDIVESSLASNKNQVTPYQHFITDRYICLLTK